MVKMSSSVRSSAIIELGSLFLKSCLVLAKALQLNSSVDPVPSSSEASVFLSEGLVCELAVLYSVMGGGSTL